MQAQPGDDRWWRSRPPRWSSPTGPSRPRRRSTPACTTRTPPGTTCPSRGGSRRRARSGRSTSPTRSSWPPGSTRRTPSFCTRSGWSRSTTTSLSPLINLGWLALSLLAAWCIGRPYAVGAATLLGAAVVLDSEMLVGSQAGNAPNDIAGIFFLLAVIAFLVNGAATARAAPGWPARPSRRRTGYAAARRGRGPGLRPEGRRGPSPGGRGRGGPRRGRPARARRASGPARCSSAALAAGPRDRHQDHPAGGARRAHDRDRLPGRPPALAAGAGHLAGRDADHRGLLVRAQHLPRGQPVPADRQARADRPAGPRPGRLLPARAAQPQRVRTTTRASGRTTSSRCSTTAWARCGR